MQSPYTPEPCNAGRSSKGEKESFVAPELIRPLADVANDRSSNDDFTEGDKVEVLYKGKGTKWFSGKIGRVNRDGTYDIAYDDGDRESGALRANVRRHPDAPQHTRSAGSGMVAALREGSRVEARYRGKARYFPGVIRRENRDGSFDIDYDDVREICAHTIIRRVLTALASQGEKETFVSPELVRAVDAGPGSPSKMRALTASLREGMKVEARYRGKEKYFPGVIRRENRGGTFDVDYNDVSLCLEAALA